MGTPFLYRHLRRQQLFLQVRVLAVIATYCMFSSFTIFFFDLFGDEVVASFSEEEEEADEESVKVKSTVAVATKKKKEASAASAAEEPEVDDEEAMAAQLMKEVCMPHPCLFSSPGCDRPRLLFHFLCLRQCLGPQARTKSHQRR